MNQLATKTSVIPATIKLSVSYKSSVVADEQMNSHPDAVIVTDPHFVIKGLNDIAASIYGFTAKEATGKKLFDLLQFEMIGISLDEAVRQLFIQGYWKGDVIYNHFGKKLVFGTRCNVIKDDSKSGSSIVIVTHNISKRLKQQKELEEAEYRYQTLVESLSEGVMLINANGTIGAYNKKAAEMFGVTQEMLKGQLLVSPEWKTIKEDGTEFPIAEYPALLTLRTGLESNNVIMGLQHTGGEMIWLSINSRPIFDQYGSSPAAAVVSLVEITEVKKVNERLIQSELLFRTFMKNSPTLGWIYDEAGTLVYGNPRFLDTVGLPENASQKNITEFINSAEVQELILNRNKQVLLNEKPVITEDKFADKEGNLRNYLSYWFLLPVDNEKRLIGGHAVEITETKKARKEIDKMFERYTFAINASSDAIWDMDISTQTIYRSETFSTFSGYKKEEIMPTSEWFFDKIHPQDRNRIKRNIDHCLKNNVRHWENEYRFQIADGSYRHLLDKGYAIYDDGRITRVIGAMQDMTERKKLEAALFNEQVQKQKMVNQAIIQAQEKERNRISGELHDNVNQLLMSAKLHICVARTRAEGETELLNKANQYLLMAVEEIRALSKTLNSAVIANAGLQKSIDEIAASMLLLKNIHLHSYISEETVAKLSPDQQMMVYRIIQEQSNNILKYAETTEAIISLKEVNNNFELIISDNGKGFDKNEQKTNGIGFINIFNRVDAYNGKVEIITTPGNGCTLLINFPILQLEMA